MLTIERMDVAVVGGQPALHACSLARKGWVGTLQQRKGRLSLIVIRLRRGSWVAGNVMQ